jgi:uncharacterized protein (DUF1330 family)
MAKGYWIAHVTVTDPDRYQRYIAGARAAFEKYRANILARGGQYSGLEGHHRPRNVVIEFESYEQALECYRSPEYQAARKLRDGAGEADVLIVEGV